MLLIWEAADWSNMLGEVDILHVERNRLVGVSYLEIKD
jgi:hypothetical protein